MAIKQLTVFVENRKGTMVSVTDILSKSNVNIRALSIAETQDFGILRLIVSDPDLACEKLREEKCTVTITDVVAIEIPDELGMLSSVMDILAEEKVNVEYMYAFLSKSNNKASIILRVDDNVKAGEAFKQSGVIQLTEKNICEL